MDIATLTGYFTAVLAIATSVLAWATVKLSNHTETLSRLTGELVRIEERREERVRMERVLSLAEKIRLADALYYGSMEGHSSDPQIQEDIRALAILERYIEDTAALSMIHQLRDLFDRIGNDDPRRRTEGVTILNVLVRFQHLLPKTIDVLREKLSKPFAN